MSVVEVMDLVKKYGSIEAVEGISFSINEKEIFGLIGPNGAGKTNALISALESACKPAAKTSSVRLRSVMSA